MTVHRVDAQFFYLVAFLPVVDKNARRIDLRLQRPQLLRFQRLEYPAGTRTRDPALPRSHDDHHLPDAIVDLLPVKPVEDTPYTHLDFGAVVKYACAFLVETVDRLKFFLSA